FERRSGRRSSPVQQTFRRTRDVRGMEKLCRTGIAPALSQRDGNSRGRPRAIERKRKILSESNAPDSSRARRRLAERAESSATRHRHEKQILRRRTERPRPLADRFSPRSESFPGRFLRLSPGIYSARDGHWLADRVEAEGVV